MKTFDEKFIIIYDFNEAPEALKILSNNGGDEDWIAIIPIHLYEKHYCHISFLESTSFDSGGEPQKIDLKNENNVTTHKILIGSHA